MVFTMMTGAYCNSKRDEKVSNLKQCFHMEEAGKVFKRFQIQLPRYKVLDEFTNGQVRSKQLHLKLLFILGICKIFEEHLKRTNPSAPSITYDISQLFDFIDELNDLSCLVCTKNKTYMPHNKEWIKEQIYIMLRKQAGK